MLLGKPLLLKSEELLKDDTSTESDIKAEAFPKLLRKGKDEDGSRSSMPSTLSVESL